MTIKKAVVKKSIPITEKGTGYGLPRIPIMRLIMKRHAVPAKLMRSIRNTSLTLVYLTMPEKARVKRKLINRIPTTRRMTWPSPWVTLLAILKLKRSWNARKMEKTLIAVSIARIIHLGLILLKKKKEYREASIFLPIVFIKRVLRFS
jgi:hypothetical protein